MHGRDIRRSAAELPLCDFTMLSQYRPSINSATAFACAGPALHPRRRVFACCCRPTFALSPLQQFSSAKKNTPVRTVQPRPYGVSPLVPSRAEVRAVPKCVFGGGGGNSSVPTQERVLSILPYLVPLLDSLSFGFYVFKRIPALNALLVAPLFPVYQIYRGVPFVAFGVFLALYILVVRNTNVPRFIRFNTYQALVLDIALIFPQLFSGVNLASVIPQGVIEVLTTSVFYAMTFAIAYSTVSNAKGELPDQIPGISDSVRDQLGPY